MKKTTINKKIIINTITFFIIIIASINNISNAEAKGFEGFNNAPRKYMSVEKDKFSDVKLRLKDNNGIKSVSLYKVDDKGNKTKINFSTADTKDDKNQLYTLSHEKLLKGKTKRFYIKATDKTGNVLATEFRVCAKTNPDHYAIDDGPRIVNWEQNGNNVALGVKDNEGTKYVKIQDGNSNNKEIRKFSNLSKGEAKISIDMTKFKKVDGVYKLRIVAEDAGKTNEQSIRTLTFKMKTGTANTTNTKPSTNTSSNKTTNVINRPTSSKIVSNKKIEKTLTTSDLNKVMTVTPKTSGCTIAQGFCVTEKYFVCALINHSDSKTSLQVYDKKTKKLKNKIETNLDHANGMAYNPNTQKIYVANCIANKYTELSVDNVVNGKKLSKTTKRLKTNLSSITYDPYTNLYYVGKGTRFYVYNSKLKNPKKYQKKICHTTQDIGAYRGLVLVIDYDNGKSAIDIYRANNGKYLGRYKLNISSELESIQYDETNKCFYLYCNTGKNGIIYKTNKINLENYWI